MAAPTIAQPVLPRSIQVLVVGTGYSGIRAVRDLLRGDARFHAHGARTVGSAAATLGQGAFDVIVVDARTWTNAANGLRTAVKQLRGVGVVVTGAGAPDAPETLDPSIIYLPIADSAEALNQALTEATSAARGLRRRETMVRWLEREAFTDSLTGLNNARALFEALRAACSDATQPRVGLIMLNVVGTGMVNHNYGRDAGDRMLRHAAAGISRCTRASDCAARLEEDTFAVLVPGADLELCRRISRRIVQELDRANTEDWHGDIPVAVSVGIASGEDCDADELLRVARQQVGRYRPHMPAPPTFDDPDDGPSVA